MQQPSPNTDALLAWVERVTTFLTAEYGLAPITARILGWLMVCDPPEQSAGQIADAIGASRASMTSNIRQLVAAGLVRRSTRGGERTSYFRVEDDAWQTVVRRRLATMGSFRGIAREGIDLLGRGSARAARVQAAHDTFQWLEEVTR